MSETKKPRGVKYWLWRFARAVLFAYVVVIVLLMLLETKMLYPVPDPAQGDWEAGWLRHEDVSFTSADGTKLHGWFCEAEDAQAVMLVCHGNGEDVARLADELDMLRSRYHVSIMAFDYRGYGKSQGIPFEKGILEDAEAAQSWLAQRTGLQQNQIVLSGRSIGGAVAVHLAGKLGARGLLLDRTCSSIVETAASHFPWLPVKLLMRNRYPSLDRIQKYDGPLLQMHGRVDEVIPFELGKKLFDAAPSKEKQFVELPGQGHNDIWPESFAIQVGEFIATLPPEHE